MNRTTPTITNQMPLRIQPAFGLADAAPSWCVFDTICRSPMGFDVAGVNHQGRKTRPIPSQGFENALKHSGIGASFVTVVQRLGRAICRWQIGSAIAALNAQNDARQHPPVINTRNAARFVRQQGADFIELFLGEPEIRQCETSQIAHLEAHRRL